jgi:adenylate cyclase class IV
MQNVEFKAELRDFALARTICGSIGAELVSNLRQTDTYFRVPDAKLKKREVPGRPTEYIFYSRPNRSRPKLSNYTLYTESQAMDRFGASPLPVWVVVKKSRDLYMYKGVRVHLDQVEGLGGFIEFEAIVSPANNLAACHNLVDELRRAFGPAMGEPIACGYAELLAAEQTSPTQT